jgi:rubredoxin
MEFNEKLCQTPEGKWEKKYYIDAKEVTRQTFDSLSQDIYDLQKPNFKENICETEDFDDDCECPECKYIRNVYETIMDADSEEEAIAILKSVFEREKVVNILKGINEVYAELGQSYLKLSGKIEQQIKIEESGAAYNPDDMEG